MKEKRVLTIQDVSCLGQCSLTVALPIISAMGIETCIIPSAVLSTHTGGFKGFTFKDLTEEIPSISAHWQKEKISFDAIYTGYVGSKKQLEYIADIFNNFGKNGCQIIIDPVMGDKGKLYTGFDTEFAKEMAKFCAHADVILPNLTEAAFLLDEPYVESGYSEEWLLGLLRRLAGLGAKKVVLTGVSFDPRKLGVAIYDSKTDKVSYYFRDKIAGSTHGTGDVYASSFVGALMQGKSIEQAAALAADYVVKCIEETLPDKENHWYGVKFEKCIPYLIKRMQK
ncbi:MAG TPA: pyridoxamine kinase [Clostridia bacterium]|nr:pyridoxamine kinase [Clostridia bacterium]